MLTSAWIGGAAVWQLEMFYAVFFMEISHCQVSEKGLHFLSRERAFVCPYRNLRVSDVVA